MAALSWIYRREDRLAAGGWPGRPALVLASLLVLLIGISWWLTPADVSAHANLASAEPAPNSELDTAPDRIIIWFTEPLEPGLSSIEVLDTTGQRVDLDNSVVDDLNQLVMSVGLGDIRNGTYTVAWKNVSTVDGHRVRGSFVFAVGQPLSGVSVERVEQPLLQSPFSPLLRWLILLGALTMVGGLVFDALVSRPSLAGRGRSEAARPVADALSSRSLRLVWVGLGVFLVASVGQLLLLTTITQEVSLWQAFGVPLADMASGTEWGRLWLWRMAAGVAFGVAVAGLAFASDLWRPALQLLAIGLGCAGLWTISLVSHGAATVDIRTLALAADFLHLLASAFWVGGLFHFALGVRLFRDLPETERRDCLTDLVPRFSIIASMSVAVIVVTGVFSGFAQVTAIEAVSTPYGITLIAKVALVLPLLFLGGLNLVWVRPRLRSHAASGEWLRRLLVGEAALGILILVAAGMLTSLEPARQVASRELTEQRQSLTFSDTVNTDTIALEVTPARVGSNNLTVTLTDRLGAPIANASEVMVRLVYLESDLGDDALVGTSRGDGTYVREGAQLSIAGAWQAELVVRRPDAFDARTAFRFEAVSTGGGGSAAISPSPGTAYLLLGVGLLVLGLMFLGAGLPLGGWFTRTGAGVMTPGIAGVAAGLLLLFNTQLGLGGGEVLRNPFAPTPESLASGSATYAQVCQTCHGDLGRGDGPAGAGLLPPPADLVVHVPLHGEADLFRFVRDGIPNTAMVPQGDRLTEEQIWHVVNYIRTLEE